MMDRSLWSKTIKAGDMPLSCGVLLNWRNPVRNASDDKSLDGARFITKVFFAIPTALALPLL
jgi:hypothetical protein